MTDEEIIKRVLAGDVNQFELIMRRNNQRLYRAARAILRDDNEAEDVMQEAYVNAFEHLSQFNGSAKFSTWLTRIAVNEALARRAKAERYRQPASAEDRERDFMELIASKELNPEQHAVNTELRELIEAAINKLPDAYREAFILRKVEGMDVAATAYALQISTDNVKVRLHRARLLLQGALVRRVEEKRDEVYVFEARRCDRIVEAVLARILKYDPPDPRSAESGASSEDRLRGFRFAHMRVPKARLCVETEVRGPSGSGSQAPAKTESNSSLVQDFRPPEV